MTSSFFGDSAGRDSTRMLPDTAVDQWQVLASPRDGPLEPGPQHGPGLEPEHALGLLRAAEALARAVPIPGRAEVERGRVTRVLVDQLGQLEDRGLDAASEVVDVAGLAGHRAQEEPAHDVLHENEVPRRHASILHRERHLLQGP